MSTPHTEHWSPLSCGQPSNKRRAACAVDRQSHEKLRLDAATVMALPVEQQGLLIQNANLVDVDRGIVVPDVTVLVRGETIDEVYIGDTPAAPPGLVVIDAHGKYLMPGLFEPAEWIPVFAAALAAVGLWDMRSR
jgi:hypothetical protein